jgi:hypothetical protein
MRGLCLASRNESPGTVGYGQVNVARVVIASLWRAFVG